MSRRVAGLLLGLLVAACSGAETPIAPATLASRPSTSIRRSPTSITFAGRCVASLRRSMSTSKCLSPAGRTSMTVAAKRTNGTSPGGVSF